MLWAMCMSCRNVVKQRESPNGAIQMMQVTQQIQINHQQAAEEEFPHIEEDNEDQLMEPLESSKVTGSTWIIDSLDHQMNSTLIPNDVWERYYEHT